MKSAALPTWVTTSLLGHKDGTWGCQAPPPLATLKHRDALGVPWGLASGHHVTSWRSNVASWKARRECAPIFFPIVLPSLPNVGQITLVWPFFIGQRLENLKSVLYFHSSGISKVPFCYNIKVESGELAINPDRQLYSNSFLFHKS